MRTGLRAWAGAVVSGAGVFRHERVRCSGGAETDEGPVSRGSLALVLVKNSSLRAVRPRPFPCPVRTGFQGPLPQHTLRLCLSSHGEVSRPRGRH